MAEKNTLSSLDDLLKEMYDERMVQDQFENQTEFYKQIEKNSRYPYAGKKLIVPLKFSLGNGNGATSEDGDLPTAGAPTYNQLAVTVTYHYNRQYVTNQAIAMANGGDSSFIEEITEIPADQIASLTKDINWKMFNLKTGARTTVNGAKTASLTVVVDSLKGLRENMLIDFYKTSAYEAQGVRITNIAESTKTLTLDTAVTVSDEAIVYQAGEKDKSMSGLLTGLSTSDTDYFGIDKSAVSIMQGNVVNSSVGTITAQVLTQLRTAAKNKDAKPAFWLTTPEIADQIWLHLLRPDQRIMGTKIAGGLDTFTYHNYPVVTDIDCPSGYIFLIDPSKIKMAQTKEGFHWTELAGSRLLPVSGKDSREITLKLYANMVVLRPNALPYAYGVSES
jgi:hypothetical protein